MLTSATFSLITDIHFSAFSHSVALVTEKLFIKNITQIFIIFLTEYIRG